MTSQVVCNCDRVTLVTGLLCFTSLHVVSLVNYMQFNLQRRKWYNFNLMRLPENRKEMNTQQEKNSSLQSQKLVPAKCKKSSVSKNKLLQKLVPHSRTISTEIDPGFYFFNAHTILFL